MSGRNNRGIKRKSSLSEKATKWGKMTAMELMVTPESLELMVAHNNGEVAWVNKQLNHVIAKFKLLMKRILFWCGGETLARIMMRTDVPTAAFVIYQEVITQREIDRDTIFKPGPSVAGTAS
ncbi:hypothetical protein ACFE04_021273 [Oxalis oulophora]